MYAGARGVVLGFTETGEWTQYLIEAHRDADYVFTFAVATYYFTYTRQ